MTTDMATSLVAGCTRCSPRRRSVVRASVAFLKGAGVAAFAVGASARCCRSSRTRSRHQDPRTVARRTCRRSEKSSSSPTGRLHRPATKKRRHTPRGFEKKSGIKVDYTDDVNDNAEFFGKVATSSAPASRSAATSSSSPTGWPPGWSTSGWIQPLDHRQDPERPQEPVPTLQPPGTRTATYSAPWQSGLTGIAYNAELTKEVRSFDELLTRRTSRAGSGCSPRCATRWRSCSCSTGADPAKFTERRVDKAIEQLARPSRDGQIRAFTGNEYVQDLAAGNIVACEAWSGDVLQPQFDNPDIKFVTPEEGLALWSDNMLVPNQATHKANAEAWMNYYYDPRSPRSWPPGSTTSARRGRPAGDGEDRQVPRRQPADLPRRGHPEEGERFMALDEKQEQPVRRTVRRCHRCLTTQAHRALPRTTAACDGLRLRSRHQAVRRVHGRRRPRPRRPEQGSFFALLGPSGCGKTTTLRMVAGLEEPTVGHDHARRQDITCAKPYKRPVNTVFQNYALFPHLDIFENVAFGLRRRKAVQGRRAAGARDARAGRAGAARSRKKPAQLSGGQQQRVALARALINRPEVLLLDEPLGALDLKLRRQMQIELKRIQTEVGLTFVHVTHDQEEAMTMADTIAVMNQGVIEQMGAPAELYENPRTTFVANFLGQSNLVEGTITGPRRRPLDGRRAGHARSRSPTGARAREPATVWVGVRPEKVLIAEAGQALDAPGNTLPGGVVTDVSFIGVSTQYLVRMPWGQELRCSSRTPGARRLFRRRRQVDLSWRPEHTFLLDADQDASRRASEQGRTSTHGALHRAEPGGPGEARPAAPRAPRRRGRRRRD